jgi:hypothetical protein
MGCISLEYVPGMESLVAGILILAMLIGVVAYGWLADEPSRQTEGSAFRKAA